MNAKWWIIARREFLSNIRKGSFLFTTFGVPLITIIMLVVVVAITVQNETDTERVGAVGYVDLAGVLEDAVEIPDAFAAYASTDAARAALDAREVGAYFVLQADYLDSGDVSLISRSDTPEALQDTFDEFLIANIARDLDPDIVARLIDPVDGTLRTLDNGREIRSEALIGIFLAPFIFVFVFLIASQTTSGFLMSGVVEEKTNRVMEILITTVTPFQLLFGKIVGLGVLGLVQLAIWLGAGFVILTFGQGVPFLAGATIPPDLVIVGLIYFLLGYFLIASMMAGIGAVVGSEQESRQFAGVISLLFNIPFFLIVLFFTDPEGPVITFLCIFPFTSPISIILRLAFASVSLELLIVSITVLFLTTIVVVWASARVFRWALLLYGKRPGLRDLLGALRRSAPIATTSPTAEKSVA